MMADSAPEEFIEQVKQALDSLYNFSGLQRLALAQRLNPEAGESAGTNLRRELIQAIEALNPGSDVFYRSSDGRLYHLLHLHYIGRMTITEVSLEMGISERQAYRDLKRGQIAVADVLWAKHFITTPVESDITRLKGHFQPVDLGELLNHARQAVERLAVQHGIQIQIDADSSTIYTNVPIARQILIKLLSYSIKQAQPGQVQISLQNQKTSLLMEYQSFLHAADLMNDVLAQLLTQLNWKLSQESHGDTVQLHLHMMTGSRTLLIIDDNEGVVELMSRFLSGHYCQILSAGDSQEGLHLARKTRPDVIVLDVMMPEMDGWELLQRLRSYPETETTPVIVCSVLHDPELAYSLGASHVIPKPVTQERLLSALHELNIF